MNGLIEWWARNSVAANLLMLVCFIGGLLGYLSLEREVFPSGKFPGATVSVAWPDASPQEIEEQIIVRIEEALSDLDGVETMGATAREGSGWIWIEGKRNLDPKDFLDEIKLRVDQVNNLPDSAFRPQVEMWGDDGQIMGIAVHGNIDPLELKRIGDQVRREVAQIPGAELSELDAYLPEEVTIEISEENLRRYGLTFDEVATAVRRNSLNGSSGTIQTDVGDVQLQTRTMANSREEFERIIIRQTPQGGIIRLGDVATVIDGFVDSELSASFNGEPMVMVSVNAGETLYVDRTAKAIKAYIEEANARLPEGVTLTLWWDDSKIYVDRMETISKNALMGLALVLILLILFLRPIVAFWVTFGIATAFAGGVMLLPFFDVSLNMLSLFAFLIVIGVVVDDAIIVGENIHKEVETGRREGLDAAIVGTQLVAKPVIFGVITTMMAFAPWMMLSGAERQFTQQISFVVIAALLFSLIESLFILPSHLSRMKPQKFDGFWGGFFRFQHTIADSLLWFAANIYKPVLELALRARYATVTLFISLFVLSIGLLASGIVPFKFMPEIENETIRVTIEMPEGTSFERSVEIKNELLAAQERVRVKNAERYPDAEVSLVDSTAAIAGSRNIRAWLSLAPPELRPGGVSTRAIAEEFRTELGPIPDAEEINFDFTINDNDSGFVFAINHPDLEVLQLAANDLKAQLRSYADIFDITDNMQSAADEARFTLKPGAESLGLTVADISRQVRQAYSGEEIDRLPRNGEDVRVMLRYPKSARTSLDSLEEFRIRTADGREIPLKEVAEITYQPGITRIERRERQRTVYVRAEIAGDNRGDIMTDLNDNFFPEWEKRYPGVSRGEVGQAEGQAMFLSEIAYLSLIMLVAMYILLAVAFRSYTQPALIMTAIPFAFTGAVFGHFMLDSPMAMFSLFGVGAAAGVVINDNLVMIDYVNRLRDEGKGAMQSLVEAAIHRFRPILLTSVTTFVGIMPMLFERSTQAEFLKPMVISLAFAVAFALFLSLFLVPSLYAVAVEIKRRAASLWNKTPYQEIGTGYDGNVDLESEIPEGRTQPAE
jgi:multidrug efflux pump subunit AcrB